MDLTYLSLSEATYSKLCRKILTESLGVRKGDCITIETWNNGLPFATQVVQQARQMGAIPILLLEDEKTFIKTAKAAPKENLGSMGDHEYALLSKTNSYVFIPGPPLAPYTKALSQESKFVATSYNNSWYEAAAKAKLKGVRLSHSYVGNDLATLLGKKKETIVQHLLEASFVDYRGIGKKAKTVLGNMSDGTDGEILSDGKSLKFKFMGQTTIEDGIVDDEDVQTGDNIASIPPGYVWREVDPKSTEGTVNFYGQYTRYGKLPASTLTFKGGKLTSWSSAKGGKMLEKLVDVIPEVKRVLSAVTVGLNPAIKYGYSQDRCVAGCIGLAVGGFAINGYVSSGTLNCASKAIVKTGKLL